MPASMAGLASMGRQSRLFGSTNSLALSLTTDSPVPSCQPYLEFWFQNKLV